MVLLESVSLESGQVMPDFTLNDPSGKSFDKNSLLGKNGLLIAFTCNHCPYAIAVWPRLMAISERAKESGINTVAINPNINPMYPDDSPEKMAEKITEWKIPFPYLVDSTQEVARAYDAQCTPDIYLLNGDSELFYHGRIDDNWRDEHNVSKEELKIAIECLASGQHYPDTQYPCMGCSIKWN
jgi:peroxiredoxin